MIVEKISASHTMQPYVEYGVYRVGDHKVEIKFGGMRQTWDCQPFRAATRILTIDDQCGPFPEDKYAEIANALIAAFPDSNALRELR